jgi:DHA2 family multidrug resistance protein
MFKIWTLLITIFLVVSGFALTLMSGLYIVSSLGGNRFLPIYTVAFFGIGNAIGVPLARRLGENFGYARALFFCMILYCFTMCITSCSTSFIFFCLSRFCEGVVSGPFYFLVAKLVPDDKKAFYTKGSMGIFALGPVFGAVFGGLVAYAYHWTWSFYLYALISFVLAICLYFFKDDPVEKIDYFDWAGYISYAITIFCFGFIGITVQELDWYRSPWIISAFILGLTSLIFFIFSNHLSKRPLIDFKLLKHPIFSFGLINVAILFSGYFGTITMLAIWLALSVHYDYAWVSIMIATMLIVGIVPIVLVSNKNFIVDARIPLCLGILFLIISCFNAMQFNAEVDFFRLVLSRVSAGIGFALFLPALIRLSFKIFDPIHTDQVINLYQIVRTISMGVGASMYMIAWHRRYVFYHERLSEGLTQFSARTTQFFLDVRNFGIVGTKANMALESTLEKQANTLALEDIFYFMGSLFTILLVSVLFTLFIERKNFIPEQISPTSFFQKH